VNTKPKSKLACIYTIKVTKVDKIDLNNQYAILENLELTGVEVCSRVEWN
jgi:hypothetical protein